jgi:hypothetical protein
MVGVDHACFESVEAMDSALARLGRTAGRLRYGLGAGLEALAQTSGHHELGFSSVEAYALERCERSTRWVQESRWLGRRLSGLPMVRRALVKGELSFSMAQVIANVAHAEDEEEWLAQARRCTVRVLRRLARERRLASRESDESSDAALAASPTEERGTLTLSVDREDAWLFECSRLVVRHVAGLTQDETIEALLGEGTTSLLQDMRRDDVGTFDDATDDVAQRAWEAERARWRDEAEARCETRLAMQSACSTDATDAPRTTAETRPRTDSVAATDTAHATHPATTTHGATRGATDDDGLAFDGDSTAIDAALRRVAGALASRDVEIGRLAEAFWAADGWRRLGYATEAQYARERVGLSLSSIKAKRALARRADRMPRLATAVSERELGYEAARLVAGVATPDTVDDWIERAGQRTVRHLREEVDAAKMLARLDRESSPLPPTDATMRAVAAVESRIVSGAVFRDAIGHAAPEGQMSAALAELLACFERDTDASPTARPTGRVTLRLRVGTGTRRYFRWLEGLFHRRGPRGVGFLRFLCCSLIDSWKHSLGSDVAYADVYARDGYRCANPVCARRDVTPHHLRFCSAGGDDSTENVASLCVWCHLEGVHGGRLRAAPPASDITWTIGRNRHTVVHGRQRARGDRDA